MMSKVFVRSLPEEDRMQISVNYNLTNGVTRTINMERLKNEELGKTLVRLMSGITKAVSNKSKKKKSGGVREDMLTARHEIEIKLLKSDIQFSDNIPNVEAWTQGAVLQVADIFLEIDFNSPTVTTLKLPKTMMAGFPVFPKVELEFADIQDCEFKWYNYMIDDKVTTQQNDINQYPKRTNSTDEECLMACCRVYSPTIDDVGCILKLVCIPKAGVRVGRETSVVSSVQVTVGPGICPFEKRHLYTMKLTGNGVFRVTTYNILSDSDHTRLYPYCAPYALELDYRKQLIAKEIIGYRSDIICLQEVDKKVFEGVLQPFLNSCNFEGLMQLKGGAVTGVAIFFRKSKFKLINQHNICITDTMEEDHIHQTLCQKVCSNEKLAKKMRGRKTPLQVTILQSLESNAKICVANTHLYFHPEFPHIRLIQTIICIQHIESVIRSYSEHRDNISVIFCGDLNSTPEHGVDDYLTTGKISPQHSDWTRTPEEYVGGMEFCHSLKLTSACRYPVFSNYVAKFQGLLDYIYIDRDKFSVSQIIPMPEEFEVTQFTALPSVVFPSDHIAQICDLTWKS